MSEIKIKYGNQHQIVKSFNDWCVENNKQVYLDCWDYDLNQKSPKEIGYQSNKKYWFWFDKIKVFTHDKLEMGNIIWVTILTVLPFIIAIILGGFNIC